MARTKMINGVEINFTAEEETARDNEELIVANNEFNKKLNDLREDRNKLLADTDYLALSDNTMSESMTTYRQQLRDATNGLETVEDVEAYEFPTKPE